MRWPAVLLHEMQRHDRRCRREGRRRKLADPLAIGRAFLQQHRLVPGTKVEVVDIAPSLGTMNLRVGKDEFTLGIEAAKKIRVH